MTDPGLVLYATPALIDVFAPASHVGQILAFEAALARAGAKAGVIPGEAAEAIAAACRVEGLNVPALFVKAAAAGTVVLPLLEALGDRLDRPGRDALHRGATSQDAIDTALMLQMRAGLELIDRDLARVADACAALADRHRHTAMAGRTLMQQAVPLPFGLKAARWLALAMRQRDALRARADEAILLQFGGAAGTLAVLGDRGLAVATVLAEELGLRLPDLPWHAERDRVAGLVAAVGVAAGSMAKIAQDIVLLSQTEVAEVSETHPANAAGSSTMPHKRNPVLATFARAAARLAMAQLPVAMDALVGEHERGAGAWQAEWAAVPLVFLYAGGAVARVADALEGLHVDEQRMRANIEAGGDVIYAESLATALTARVGKADAVAIVGSLTETIGARRSLRAAAGADARIAAVLSQDDLEHIFQPASSWGSAQAFIDRALASHGRREPGP